MSEQSIALIAGLLTVVSAALELYRRTGSDPRDLLVKDVQILQGLATQDQRREISQVISRDLEKLSSEQTARRDPLGTSLGVSFLAIAGFLIYLIAEHGGWWWASVIGVVVFGVFGLYGTMEGLQKRERDSKGRVIPPSER